MVSTRVSRRSGNCTARAMAAAAPAVEARWGTSRLAPQMARRRVAWRGSPSPIVKCNGSGAMLRPYTAVDNGELAALAHRLAT
jgi:hypothetical protein